MGIIISSGHGLHVPGANGIINEVTEARRVTDRVAALLQQSGTPVQVFHDNSSHNQRDNIHAIVNFHNGHERMLDVSVHFNSFIPANDFVQMPGFRQVARGVGVEVLYANRATERAMAEQVSAAIADSSGLINRGARLFTNLGFLNNTHRPSILIEVCFVNSVADVRLYQQHFEAICASIAKAITGQNGTITPPPVSPQVEQALATLVQAGVINTPAHWRQLVAAGQTPFLDRLLLNIADQLTTTSPYLG